MAKVRVVNNNLDNNINGDSFNNIASEIVFSLGTFNVTSNFDGRVEVDYSKKLSSFAKPISLDSIGMTDTISNIVDIKTNTSKLNLDNSNLSNFVRFGSAYELLRISVENILLYYPFSLYLNSQLNRISTTTVSNFTYDVISNTSYFEVSIDVIDNKYGLVYVVGNTATSDGYESRNLNLYYNNYIVWNSTDPDNNTCNIIGFTGASLNNMTVPNYKKILVKCNGNPFPNVNGSSAPLDFHIKPNNNVFEEYRQQLGDYEQYMISNRNELKGFSFKIKTPTLLDNGDIKYSDTNLTWTTTDKYNLDIDGASYTNFIKSLLTIGEKFDAVKTNLIARFLTPTSLITYDLTDNSKMSKLLKIYGAEFDVLRQFIDSLVNINKVTYDKKNNLPDQIVKNMAKTFGWDYFSLVDNTELIESIFNIDENERNLGDDLLPAEIDIELWRRILMNTNYFWKTKGTRESIMSIFKLIGIPEPFINITEYVYTVDGKINPNEISLSQIDFPSNSLPYDSDGYPVAPLETNKFYFQMSGDTDGGQAYMDVFRMAGFNLTKTVDNKKSWIQTGNTIRIDDSMPNYEQEDNKLILNTKEVDIGLDASRGVEYDVFEYLKNDYIANSDNYLRPYTFVNLSLGYNGSQNTFSIPSQYAKYGDFEVRFNGILLNAPKISTFENIISNSDYTIDYQNNTFTLVGEYANNNLNKRDVVQVTFITSGDTSIENVTINYMVTRLGATVGGTEIPLPSYPRGDVQLTVNGIALTKGTAQFNADYILDPNNSVSGDSKIILQNQSLISYLAVNREVQVTYIEVDGSDNINARNEILRVDSFNTSKFYYNSSMNKNVYVLNYKAISTKDLKILINGIALEPETDYKLNTSNPYEVYLPKGIGYGSIISVYYIVGQVNAYDPIIDDIYGIGDITEISFLEFIEAAQRRLINVQNRKTITNFKGGWYPTLYKVYAEYISRSYLSESDPLKSNGYTFYDLYSFISKYNSFFERFVNQLLSPTIIRSGTGMIIRNTIFTKQKFTYMRGVNLYYNNLISSSGKKIGYLGDDGSTFKMVQQVLPVDIDPENPFISVETIEGELNSDDMIFSTGGINIQGIDYVTEYGIEYRVVGDETWYALTIDDDLVDNYFNIDIDELEYSTNYEYRAYLKSGVNYVYGDTFEFTTNAEPLIPSISTIIGDVISSPDTIYNTGGDNIVGYEYVEYYGMQYSASTGSGWNYYPTVPYSTPLTSSSFDSNIEGLSSLTDYKYRSFITISGDTYYGDSEKFSTSPIPLVVITGDNPNSAESYDGMQAILDDNQFILTSEITSVSSYGIIYTYDSQYNNTNSLRLENVDDENVFVVRVDENTTSPFDIEVEVAEHIQELMYYRAFAISDTYSGQPYESIGYGNIETFEVPLSQYFSLAFNISLEDTMSPSDDETDYYITTDHTDDEGDYAAVFTNSGDIVPLNMKWGTKETRFYLDSYTVVNAKGIRMKSTQTEEYVPHDLFRIGMKDDNDDYVAEAIINPNSILTYKFKVTYNEVADNYTVDVLFDEETIVSYTTTKRVLELDIRAYFY